GYRPCLRCRPLELGKPAPDWVRALADELQAEPDRRIRDADLRDRGLDPATVRRWFQRHHGMTFQAWQRGLRLGGALRALGNGGDIAAAGYEAGYESLSGFYDAVKRWTGKSPGRSRDASVIRLTRIGTPMGPMVAGATDAALTILEFADRRMLETQLERLAKRTGAVFAPGRNEVLERAEAELAEYFAGERHEFDVPLETNGTEFQERVWTVLREIPYGETRSYAEQARRLGEPGAVRAVARANGDNRVAIVIPCHRVVGSDGKLTGYGGGLWRKRLLLALERGEAIGTG
ncbi:MAG TPA: methylated-DNA--[protein]-cysteine S-methyltransferase, partial [Gemmatimonadota bacterium]|nr:methylated-DNA--[protein]-cysteine S-methyltransferase [Gemmatimonadota bacterium]